MARARKRGPPARRRSSDGEFPAKQKSGSKRRASPQKKRVRKDQQQETVDEGIAATPEDSSLQASVENDDSTYASSPPNPASQTTPLQASARKKATRGAQGNQKPRDPNSGRFAADKAGQTGTGTAAGSRTRSKIVVLKVAAHKLVQLAEATGRRAEKIVTLKISSDRLRRFQPEPVKGELLPVDEAVEEGLAKMAPVKDQTPHQVFDGTAAFYSMSGGTATNVERDRSHQERGAESTRSSQHHPWLSARVTRSIDQEGVSALPTLPVHTQSWKHRLPSHPHPDKPF